MYEFIQSARKKIRSFVVTFVLINQRAKWKQAVAVATKHSENALENKDYTHRREKKKKKNNNNNKPKEKQNQTKYKKVHSIR